MITEERINQNYLTLIKKLQAYGCYSEEMMNDIGERVKNGSYSMHDEYGGCYKGSLVDVTLHTLCRIGYEINENVFGKKGNQENEYAHPLLAVNTNKLMRVLLLLNLGKAVMFDDETEEWKIKKGQMYRFHDFDTTLKLGQRTLFICQKYGIVLEEDEYETILAADDSEESALRLKTPLYMLAKSAKLFTMVELKRKWMSEHPVVTEKIEK